MLLLAVAPLAARLNRHGAQKNYAIALRLYTYSID